MRRCSKFTQRMSTHLLTTRNDRVIIIYRFKQRTFPIDLAQIKMISFSFFLNFKKINKFLSLFFSFKISISHLFTFLNRFQCWSIFLNEIPLEVSNLPLLILKPLIVKISFLFKLLCPFINIHAV